MEAWDDWVEWDPRLWPRRVPRHYQLIPTVCFNCESACGLLGWVDRETMEVRKFEGNPAHPGSRGRNCAKGPATLNQVNDPDRILYAAEHRVYVSLDGGRFWRALEPELPQIKSVAWLEEPF